MAVASRRTFLKVMNSLGIFACLPTIEIRQGVSMELMQRFCNPLPSARYAMSHPFIENGNATATDSRIGIRVFDSMGIADRDNPLKIPPMAHAFESLWKPAAAWNPIPEAKITRYRDWDDCCIHCNGYGFHGPLHECENCYGTGLAEGCDGQWNERCQHCYDGYSSPIRCSACKGNPPSVGGGLVQLSDNLKINAYYFNLVRQLPDARWSFDQDQQVMLVEFQGGQSMVMGIKTYGPA